MIEVGNHRKGYSYSASKKKTLPGRIILKPKIRNMYCASALGLIE